MTKRHQKCETLYRPARPVQAWSRHTCVKLSFHSTCRVPMGTTLRLYDMIKYERFTCSRKRGYSVCVLRFTLTAVRTAPSRVHTVPPPNKAV